ncbi:MAG: phage major capsid family protein, partial [Planctomycetota bacterium]
QDYMLSGYPAKVQNDINRAYSAFCDMTDYIMYRRLGAQFRTTTEGQTLFRNNTMLVACRARFGGQLALAAACAVMTDGDSTDG